MFSLAKAFTFLFACAATLVVSSGRTIFCYWGTWAYYRPGQGKFEPSHIDPHLCTHIGYGFFGMTEAGTIRSLDTWLDIDLKNIAKTVALKQQNRNLKVLASVGGWNEGSPKYSAMAANPAKRATFISSVVAFLKQHGFDGLDLDWEYPNQRGGNAADRNNYITLLRELKAAFNQHHFLLTAAVAAAQSSASKSYDIKQMSQHLDLINVMAYDFHGAWEHVVGHNAPLQGAGPLTTSAAINYWLSQGAPASKLVLGLPFYGRTFTLSDSSRTTVGSPAQGAGVAGPFTREAGYLGYNEICTSINQWKQEWDGNALVPYAHKGNQWVGYDNVRSLTAKMNFIKQHNLAGAMVWSIETDDFHGACGGGKFPLLRAINNGMKSDGMDVEKPITSAPVVDIGSSVLPPNDNRDCTQNGYYRHTNDCESFFVCTHGARRDFVCPSGLYFDQSVKACNWPHLVDCTNE